MNKSNFFNKYTYKEYSNANFVSQLVYSIYSVYTVYIK